MASATLPLILCALLPIAAAAPDSKEAQQESLPQLTGCVSTNMETFRCTWNIGSLDGPSDIGGPRLFYLKQNALNSGLNNWSECPHYSLDNPHECFFDESHTSIWTQYGIQLRSGDRSVLYDENFLFVQDIVEPDPPIGLNWTLLNVSSTGTNFDIMLSWKPPESADVQMGWMTLTYEVQHRPVTSNHWEVMDLAAGTHRTLYGLQTNVNHEVRVRCKMHGMQRFGEFSDPVYIHIPSKVSRFPVVASLIIGASCLVVVLMLVIISQQEKLMVVLLPPVPEPKIKGVDPELLKKGKLQEFKSILGGGPDLRPELYTDPWVEFIDLDMEQQNRKLVGPITDHLMESSGCSPLSLGFRDDDSGRSSCCEQDLICDLNTTSPSLEPPNPTQTFTKDSTCLTESVTAGVQTPLSESSGVETMYTQVSEVRSGDVLLSAEDEVHRGSMMGKNRDSTEALVLTLDHGDYTAELNKSAPSQSVPGSSPSSVPVYTVVEGLDGQNGFLLTPNSKPAPKTLPPPGGYLIPDLLSSITP